MADDNSSKIGRLEGIVEGHDKDLRQLESDVKKFGGETGARIGVETELRGLLERWGERVVLLEQWKVDEERQERELAAKRDQNKWLARGLAATVVGLILTLSLGILQLVT